MEILEESLTNGQSDKRKVPGVFCWVIVDHKVDCENLPLRKNARVIIPGGAGFSGEVVACLVRVPVEIVKQRRQADAQRTAVQIVRQTLRSEGKGTFWHFD